MPCEKANIIDHIQSMYHNMHNWSNEQYFQSLHSKDIDELRAYEQELEERMEAWFD